MMQDLQHDDGGGLMAFFVVVGQAALWQNSSQSSPLSQMKLVISRKAWYVTTCSRGMIDDDELMCVLFMNYVCVCVCHGG